MLSYTECKVGKTNKLHTYFPRPWEPSFPVTAAPALVVALVLLVVVVTAAARRNQLCCQNLLKEIQKF
jgi:hypothetical protein